VGETSTAFVTTPSCVSFLRQRYLTPPHLSLSLFVSGVAFRFLVSCVFPRPPLRPPSAPAGNVCRNDDNPSRTLKCTGLPHRALRHPQTNGPHPPPDPKLMCHVVGCRLLLPLLILLCAIPANTFLKFKHTAHPLSSPLYLLMHMRFEKGLSVPTLNFPLILSFFICWGGGAGGNPETPPPPFQMVTH